jgi:hypothetical protein
MVRKVVFDESSINSRIYSLIGPDAPDVRGRPQPEAPRPIVWKALTPPDGTFTVMLPSPFDAEGKLYFAKGEGLSFMLTYVDIPPQAPGPVDVMMAGAAWGLASSVCSFSVMGDASCDVRLAKKVSLAAYPGLEYTITEDDCVKAIPGLLRVYATPTRIYALAVIGAGESDPRTAKYLNSFSIKK